MSREERSGHASHACSTSSIGALDNGHGNGAKRSPGRPKSTSVAKVVAPKKRVLTAAGRARISAALKRRWAEKRKSAKA